MYASIVNLPLRRERLLAGLHGPHVGTVNSWNEWTEGSYLEPDTVRRPAYLEAIQAVFDARHPLP